MAFFFSFISDFSLNSTAPAHCGLSLFHVVFLDTMVYFDGQEVMISRQNRARKALADFLVATDMQRAHWYAIMESKDCNVAEEINKVFPPLSHLLGIREDLFAAVGELAGVIVLRRGVFSVPLHAWEKFIAEYKLTNELTSFSVANKTRMFIRVGSWSHRHPGITPKAIWKKRGEYNKPMLRVSTVTMAFAAAIGTLEVTAAPTEKEINVDGGSKSSIDVSSSDSDDSDSGTEKDEDRHSIVEQQPCPESLLSPPVNLPLNEFPLLNSLRIQNESQMNALIQEIVKYNGSNLGIEFVQRNNRTGFLVPFPSCRSCERYTGELSKKEGVIDSILHCIGKSTGCNEREAAECLLKGMFKKHEEAFTFVSIEKGLAVDPEKKMNSVQIEAMLSEAGLCKNSSRILFRHLTQFFGKGKFESEHKRRAYFSGNDFPPVVDRIILQDKTIVDFWYKEPDKMLQNQINNIIKKEQLQGITRVDLTVGGDHGGGKFRMTLKILFRFQDSSATISRLFQVANVSHSKDETRILKTTVLDPIGDSLRNICEGGQFIVHSDAKNALSLSFAINVSLCVCP